MVCSTIGLPGVPQNRMSIDTVSEMLKLFDTQYRDFMSESFWKKRVSECNFRHGNWVHLTLRSHQRVPKTSWHEAHWHKREYCRLPGTMLNQDGANHERIPGQCWDMTVTMDNSTSEIYSAFFIGEEGTTGNFTGVGDVIRSRGLFYGTGI